MKLKLFLLVVFCIGATMFTSGAAVVVSKNVTYNPTISVTGLANRPTLRGNIEHFLKVCGWFELSAEGSQSDYLLTLSGQGGNLRMDLTQGGAPLGQWSIPTRFAEREVAKTAVDAVIEKTFKDLKVRGFCHSKIAFCAQTAPGIRNIFICDIDGNNIQQVTSYRGLCVEPSWRPDGKSICYSKYGRTTLDIAETTVSGAKRSRILSNYNGINAGASISPDCRSMAMILSPDHMVDLYTMNLASRQLTRITRGKAVEASPCWSPDGSQIAFVSDAPGSPRIQIADLRSRKVRTLPSVGSDAVTPDWSQDGKIVYAARVSGGYTLAVYDLNNNTNKRVLDKPGNWESPTWAADNRQVVCKRSDGPKGTLYIVDTWTGNTRLLVSTPNPLSMPAWSPCVRK